MSFDEALAERIRGELEGEEGLTEQRMFGGLSFLIHGNMCVGVMGDGIVVRVPPETHDEAVARPRAYPFAMTGRPMRGWVQVDAGGLTNDADLASWVDEGRHYARSLPPKAPKAPKSRKSTKKT